MLVCSSSQLVINHCPSRTDKIYFFVVLLLIITTTTIKKLHQDNQEHKEMEQDSILS